MKIFLLLFALFFVGCAGASSNSKPETNPATNAQWTIMQHYSKKYVCSNLSDEAYFNMIWGKIEEDMVAITERKKEPKEYLLIYKQELKKDVVKNRTTYRERYGCPP